MTPLHLVTGGGGFLGRHIVRQLVERGDRVRTLGRHQYDHLPAAVEQRRGDITDAESVRAAVDGVDCVFHVAALAGVCRPRQLIESINIGGTQNVVAACEAAAIPRLVYTSTPSVVFGRRGHIDADESLPLPAPSDYLDHYPRTKAIAEQRVLGQTEPIADNLRTVALRPHLVFGPEDQSLLPRVVSRARSGRLRIVGDGTNPISVAYVENVAAAHLQAADELAGQARCNRRAYFINEPEPVDAKEWIQTLLAMAGQPRCDRHISARMAYAIGAVMERVWPWVRSDEPPMTRFVARQLSEPHSFRIDAARQDFGYAPPVDWIEALRRTEAWARERLA